MDRTGFVRRFSRTERTGHWLNASAFLGLLATGLVLYVPALSDAVGRRPLVKAIHLYIAIGWVLALLVVVLAGDRRALRQTRRELERFDLDDVRWLAGWPAPQGRFNAGQKVHAVAQAAIAVLFAFSGVLLWLGERNTTFRLDGTIVLHDVLTYVATILVVGHLYLALISPHTRPALRGIIRGTVRESWARAQHPKWIADVTSSGASTAVAGAWPRPGVRRFLIAAALLSVSIGTYAALRPSGSAPASASARTVPFSPAASLPPAIARGTVLANHAQALDQAGHLAEALPLFAQATSLLPGIADIRMLYGWALARSGRSAEAVRELAHAVRLDPSLPAAHLYLGVVLGRTGRPAQARAELQHAVKLDPGGPTAASARQFLARH